MLDLIQVPNWISISAQKSWRKTEIDTTFHYMIHCHLLTSLCETSSDTTQIISFTTQDHPKMSHLGKYYSRIKLLKSGVTISKPFVCRLLLTYESVAAGPYWKKKRRTICKFFLMLILFNLWLLWECIFLMLIFLFYEMMIMMMNIFLNLYFNHTKACPSLFWEFFFLWLVNTTIWETPGLDF